MTLEERIAHEREVAEDNRSAVDNFLVDGYKERKMCLQSAEEHEQLVEWLEELQTIRKNEEEIRADEKAKTIDEFAEKLKREHYALCAWQDEENFQYPSYLLIDDVYRHIDKVAEQLKE